MEEFTGENWGGLAIRPITTTPKCWLRSLSDCCLLASEQGLT